VWHTEAGWGPSTPSGLAPTPEGRRGSSLVIGYLDQATAKRVSRRYDGF
jgi:hypothetical protein